MKPPVKPLLPRAHDQLDERLLSLLAMNARESSANLARKLGVARSTVVARLARLERDGVIVGYGVRLRQDIVGQGLQALVGLTVQPRAGAGVVRQLTRLPQVKQLDSVSGEFDYLALVRADSAEKLDALLDLIGELEGVQRTTTSVLLSRRIDRT